MAKVFLNFGHGGQDCGAIGCDGKTYERDLNKKIGEKVAAELKRTGLEVDTYQQTRNVSEIAVKEKKDDYLCFISIHSNASALSTANGVETLFYPTSRNGRALAKAVQSALISGTGLRDRGIKERSDLYVLKSTRAPAILVECGFLTNEKELKNLKSAAGQKAIAKAIADGVALFEDYLGR